MTAVPDEPTVPDEPDEPDFTRLACPTPFRGSDRIMLGHGGGGQLTRELVAGLFVPAFANDTLARLADAAVLDLGAALAAGGRLAITTDASVVRPLFFPGGSIGDLAVNGTVNDLAMTGARPLALAAAFIVEEGFPIADLERLVAALAAAARRAGVDVVTGDTKVVERGHGDGCYVATTGIGVVPPGVTLGPDSIRPGDAVLVSGTLADHGMAILGAREGLGFEADITSDTAPLHGLVATLLAACPGTRMLRDPTRGGVATSLGEIAEQARLGIEFDEGAVPVAPAVAAACEILGLDPLHVASEGKLLAVVPAEDVHTALDALRGHALGRRAAVLGRVVAGHTGTVVMRTAIGGSRVIPMPLGEQLPRIC